MWCFSIQQFWLPSADSAVEINFRFIKQPLLDEASTRKVPEFLKSWAFLTTTATVAAIAVLIAASGLYFGSLNIALHVLRGAILTPDVSSKDLGSISPGSARQVRFVLTNRSNSTVRLTGAQLSCTCLLVGQLPLDVGAGQQIPFDITVRGKPGSPANRGKFGEKVVISTDFAGQPTLALELTGSSLIEPAGGSHP